ncbi:hypothetical protein RRG08_014610 [Elysia crispata]|uniref:Uncharacterized protein n=1 Tax=Elysia crispata TaxID=231223 RepID=A0AAE0YSA5_9GAST|nr:hypothetical protein RRG08_014610 [Elysia crispata]
MEYDRITTDSTNNKSPKEVVTPSKQQAACVSPGGEGLEDLERKEGREEGEILVLCQDMK